MSTYRSLRNPTANYKNKQVFYFIQTLYISLEKNLEEKMFLFYFIPSVIRIMVYFLMLLKLWTEWKWDARIVKLNLCIDILNKTIEKILKKKMVNNKEILVLLTK